MNTGKLPFRPWRPRVALVRLARPAALDALAPLALLVSLGLLMVVLLVGCQAAPAQPTPRPQPAADTLPVRQVATGGDGEPSPTAVAGDRAAEQSGAITLTVWTTEMFSPTEAITSGQILADEVQAFESAHPGVRLNFVLKAPYGEGGLLDFLLTAGAVVPDRLPDLMLLDIDELNAAAQTGRLQPLDGLLPAELVEDLYPFARQSATVDGRLYGLQFQADLDHLVYNTGKIAVPPRSWPGVLSGPGPYLLPAGGKSGLANDALLLQYLAVRDQTRAGEDGGSFLDLSSVSTVLQFYYDALSRGIVPARVANYHSTDDCWSDYLGGQAALAQVSAHRYLQDRDRLSGSGVAPIPAMHGPAAPIARGWALVLVTTDPARQAAAAGFMAQVMNPAMNAVWNQAARYLPTRVSAMAMWPPEDSYGRFIDQQLQEARPRPVLSDYAQVMAALQQAVMAVLSGTATPEQAAAQVVTPQ